MISTIDFADRLSAYNIFDGAPKNLIPAAGFETISINAKLFTDYAYKQRLIKVPYGTQLKKSPDHALEFPNGTLLTKTFYYYNDERDTSQGRNIIETRLLIKEAGNWNAATYRWNDMQTDAILEKNGYEKQISWINQMGHTRTTSYKIPTSNECIACHLSNQSVIPLGATIKNLNTLIKQNNKTINQLIHFQNIRILNDFPVWDAPFMVDYNDPDASLSDRGRAYLAINCAHCHNPTAWDIPSLQGFDFRYETPFHQTGIFFEQEEIIRNVSNQRMPFIGTTMHDEEGVTLLLNYIQSLQN
ncbi:MAG: hypothetical protein ACON43_01260 [Flavobacteriaceae bacterium]